MCIRDRTNIVWFWSVSLPPSSSLFLFSFSSITSSPPPPTNSALTDYNCRLNFNTRKESKPSTGKTRLGDNYNDELVCGFVVKKNSEGGGGYVRKPFLFFGCHRVGTFSENKILHDIFIFYWRSLRVVCGERVRRKLIRINTVVCRNTALVTFQGISPHPPPPTGNVFSSFLSVMYRFAQPHASCTGFAHSNGAAWQLFHAPKKLRTTCWAQWKISLQPVSS